MSAPETAEFGSIPAPHFGPCALDVVEIAAFRGRAAALTAIAAARGLELPPLGRLSRHAAGAVLSVRPERWLLLLARQEPGVHHAQWAAASEGAAAAIDLSAALSAYYVDGLPERAWQAGGCRLDLAALPADGAAATSAAQTALIMVRRPRGWLLLGPSTFGGHLEYWLKHSIARGGSATPALALTEWLGDQRS